MSILLYTSLLAGCETISMTLLTHYARNHNLLYLVFSIFIYALVIPFLVLYSLKFESIGTVNFLWNIITTVSMIVIGYYVFHDKVNHLHLISLMLGVAAIIVLMLADRKK